jgi:hypothetical protein
MNIITAFFQTQFHKSRDGYFINHDNLMTGTVFQKIINFQHKAK